MIKSNVNELTWTQRSKMRNLYLFCIKWIKKALYWIIVFQLEIMIIVILMKIQSYITSNLCTSNTHRIHAVQHVRTTVRMCNAMHWLITLKKICVGSRQSASVECYLLSLPTHAISLRLSLYLSFSLPLSLPLSLAPLHCLWLRGAKKQLLNVYLFACRRLRRRQLQQRNM